MQSMIPFNNFFHGYCHFYYSFQLEFQSIKMILQDLTGHDVLSEKSL